MRPAKNIERYIQNIYTKKLQVTTTTNFNERVLANLMNTLEEQKTKTSNKIQPNIWRIIMKSLFTKFTVAAGIIIIVLSGLNYFGSSSIAWADVVEKFRTVSFYSVSIFLQEDIDSELQKIELWMNRKGQARAYSGTQVIFGNKGNVTNAFDIELGTTVEPQYRPTFFLKKLSTSDEFSLETILTTIFEGKIEDLKPLINTDAVISQDIVVFDIQPHDNEFWVRIWALRESKLPVRIKAWDPSDGDSFEAFFEYSKEQEDDFFDPDSFEALMQSHDVMSRVKAIYAFYKDPGGKSILPEDIIKNTGYHMPEVKQTGMTDDGVFWVISEKASNRMSIGLTFYGFSNIKDDLGRTYYDTFTDTEDNNDTCLNFFVPEDFPFDQRKPSKVTLICETPKIYPDRKSELVGTIELTQWDENTKCPNISGEGYKDSLYFKIFLADSLSDEDTDRLNRLLATIPKWSEQPDNLSLHAFWIRIANRQKKFDEVIEIGQAFSSLLFENPDRLPRSLFKEYLTALAYTNQLDEAKKLFNRIESVAQFLPMKDDRNYGLYLSATASRLSKEAGLSVEQINEILSVDIENDSRFKNFPDY